MVSNQHVTYSNSVGLRCAHVLYVHVSAIRIFSNSETEAHMHFCLLQALRAYLYFPFSLPTTPPQDLASLIC